ncbi:MAG: hypothetical protein IID40_01610, partial [Planctomycetes bacterium]|nr:hypothetical protein [Planctomycetota bacterium]
MLVNHPWRWVWLPLVVLCISRQVSANTIHVDANVVGGLGNGTSWANAFAVLQDALDAASLGDDIWVAQGAYTPSEQTSGTDPRTATFLLPDGVRIYGGFAGVEQTLSDRDLGTYVTTLTGDLSGDDDTVGTAENAYHVVTANGVGPGTVLDGFQIMAGNADGWYANLDDHGGGMLVLGAACTIRNCQFVENNSSHRGGGLYNGSG